MQVTLRREIPNFGTGRGTGSGAPAVLQDDPLIPHPPRHSLAVEVFEQRYRILARHPEQVLEVSYVQLGGLCLLRDYSLAQGLERRAMKHEVIRKLDQHMIAQQQRDNLLGAHLVHWQGSQHFLQPRDLQACLGEGLLDLRLRFRLFVAENHTPPGKTQQLAVGLQLLLAQQYADHSIKQLGIDRKSTRLNS